LARFWPALELQQADDDDLVQAFLIDFNLAAVEGPRFFFHNADDRDRAAAALQAHFPSAGARSIDIADEEWAARSQASLRAVRVGSLVIAPPWDIPAESGFSRTIIIQPSMGFGTGHHATTRLCLAALQQIDLQDKSVIDVGTGSGVLAIAARRLGASGVLAIDDDADAIAAAEENVARNRESRIALEVADLRGSKIGQFDIVIAHLTGGLLIASAERLQSFAVPGGRLVLSGFMDHEERDVLAAFDGAIESRAQEDEWICAVIDARSLSFARLRSGTPPA
jgi:ribosomal protein L11 methyltransferase